MKAFLAVVLALAFCIPAFPHGRSSGFHQSRASHSSSTRAPREHRSSSARTAFKKQTGYPHGRNGYVIDHVTPLACGGADAPSNMQWQTQADAKAKDKVERKSCGK